MKRFENSYEALVWARTNKAGDCEFMVACSMRRMRRVSYTAAADETTWCSEVEYPS